MPIFCNGRPNICHYPTLCYKYHIIFFGQKQGACRLALGRAPEEPTLPRRVGQCEGTHEFLWGSVAAHVGGDSNGDDGDRGGEGSREPFGSFMMTKSPVLNVQITYRGKKYPQISGFSFSWLNTIQMQIWIQIKPSCSKSAWCRGFWNTRIPFVLLRGDPLFGRRTLYEGCLHRHQKATETIPTWEGRRELAD